MTVHTLRTALHLATFNHACPLIVAQALLHANRHMVLVQDAHRYTPVHNVAFFAGESLVKVICDTAIMVEQEWGDRSKIPPTSGTSPLFLAAKRGAPLRTLRQLLSTRGRTEWIAPSTGAEPYWMESLDEYSSPLEILLRDRAVKAWHLQRMPDGGGGEEEGAGGGEGFRSTILQPRILWQMKLMANERLRVYYQGTDRHDDDCQDSMSHLPTLVDELDDITTEQEMEALSLWSKCIELLAEHVPRLLEVRTGRQKGDVDDEDVDDSWLGSKEPPPRRTCSRNFGVVHCISAAKVPLPTLLQVALMVYPEQALQRDEHGMLPLHHVLTACHPYATKSLVSILLPHAPSMALVPRPRSTTMPISMALTKGLSLDILKELLWADSDMSLMTKDLTTGLYPFALAAASHHEDSDYDLDVVYTLLNAHPQALSLSLQQHQLQ